MVVSFSWCHTAVVLRRRLWAVKCFDNSGHFSIFLKIVLNQFLPMQARRGKMKNKLVRLLHLSALAIMLHPLGAQLASGTTRVAADCGVEWTREAVDLAMAGERPTPNSHSARGSRVSP